MAIRSLLGGASGVGGVLGSGILGGTGISNKWLSQQVNPSAAPVQGLVSLAVSFLANPSAALKRLLALPKNPPSGSINGSTVPQTVVSGKVLTGETTGGTPGGPLYWCFWLCEYPCTAPNQPQGGQLQTGSFDDLGRFQQSIRPIYTGREPGEIEAWCWGVYDESTGLVSNLTEVDVLPYPTLLVNGSADSPVTVPETFTVEVLAGIAGATCKVYVCPSESIGTSCDVTSGTFGSGGTFSESLTETPGTYYVAATDEQDNLTSQWIEINVVSTAGLTCEINGSTGPVSLTGPVVEATATATGGGPGDSLSVYICPSAEDCGNYVLSGSFGSDGDWSGAPIDFVAGTSYVAVEDNNTQAFSNWVEVEVSEGTAPSGPTCYADAQTGTVAVGDRAWVWIEGAGFTPGDSVLYAECYSEDATTSNCPGGGTFGTADGNGNLAPGIFDLLGATSYFIFYDPTANVWSNWVEVTSTYNFQPAPRGGPKRHLGVVKRHLQTAVPRATARTRRHIGPPLRFGHRQPRIVARYGAVRVTQVRAVPKQGLGILGTSGLGGGLVSGLLGKGLLTGPLATLLRGGEPVNTTMIWDYGDGTVQGGQYTVHTYSTPGSYGPVLTLKLEFPRIGQEFVIKVYLPGILVQALEEVEKEWGTNVYGLGAQPSSSFLNYNQSQDAAWDLANNGLKYFVPASVNFLGGFLGAHILPSGPWFNIPATMTLHFGDGNTSTVEWETGITVSYDFEHPGLFSPTVTFTATVLGVVLSVTFNLPGLLIGQWPTSMNITNANTGGTFATVTAQLLDRWGNPVTNCRVNAEVYANGINVGGDIIVTDGNGTVTEGFEQVGIGEGEIKFTCLRNPTVTASTSWFFSTVT